MAKDPQKLTQFSPRAHPEHLVGKRITQKDTINDITSDKQVNSHFPHRRSPASLALNPIKFGRNEFLFYLTSRYQPYPYPSYHKLGMWVGVGYGMIGRESYGVAAYPEQTHCHTLPYMYPYHMLSVDLVRVRIGQRSVWY